MERRKVHALLRVALLALLALVVAFVFLLAYTFRQWKVMKERQSDIETLTLICMNSTNIASTDDLLKFVERGHIKIYAPLAVDPKKPCFRLVNPHIALTETSVFYPDAILLEETNVRDHGVIWISTMDGSVELEPGKTVE
jgi:hypothetical protein